MRIQYSQLGSILILVYWLSGCTDLRPYHAREDDVANTNGQTMPLSVKSDHGNSCKKVVQDKKDNDDKPLLTCVSVVEYDDFGHLYNRTQLEQTIRDAKSIAGMNSNNKPNGGIIIVYVHGWHHDAREDYSQPEGTRYVDSDLKRFRKTIEDLGRLNKESFEDDRRIMGIYVGWRGESVDFPLINLATFWDRKNTAHAVGNGAVFELFKELSLIRERNPTSRLIVIGHSFGAAVVYSAVWNAVMSQILEDPEDTGTPINTENKPKRWDMIVLVNPAFEALKVRPHYEAARFRTYPIGQLPHLIFVTSKADFATKEAFALGRYVSTIFKAYGDAVSAKMNTSAIGHYTPYVTHQLKTVAKNIPECLKKDEKGFKPPGDTKITKVNKVEHVFNSSSYCFADNRTVDLQEPTTTQVSKNSRFVSTPKNQGQTDDTDKTEVPFITRCDTNKSCTEVADTHYIQRFSLENGDPKIPIDPRNQLMPLRMPIMNIRTTDKIMKNHNDIWNPTMQTFLVQFLLLTVGPETEPKEQSRATSDVRNRIPSNTRQITRGNGEGSPTRNPFPIPMTPR